MTAQPSINPLMLRVYKDDKKGATAFFRNRVFLDFVLNLVADSAKGRAAEVLFHACSIGAEPYSFAAASIEKSIDVMIDATDIEPEFVKAAKQGVYPAQIVGYMRPDEKKWFAAITPNEVQIDEKVKARVNFLDACSLTEPVAKKYDAVFAMNVLTYLSPEAQTKAIATMAQSANRYLCITAFHPDQIKADIEAAGLKPVLINQEQIHNSWGDRIRPNGAQRGTPEYSWVCPPYNTDFDDYAWRYCAIFEKA